MSAKTVTFSGARTLPAIGQGTWYMGEKASLRKTEADALRAGIDLGLRLIDTAEMYAEGGLKRLSVKQSKACAITCIWCRKSTRGMPAGRREWRHVKPACDGLAPTASICICCTGAAVLTWKTRLN
jgi:hypothetical protein